MQTRKDGSCIRGGFRVPAGFFAAPAEFRIMLLVRNVIFDRGRHFIGRSCPPCSLPYRSLCTDRRSFDHDRSRSRVSLFFSFSHAQSIDPLAFGRLSVYCRIFIRSKHAAFLLSFLFPVHNPVIRWPSVGLSVYCRIFIRSNMLCFAFSFFFSC